MIQPRAPVTTRQRRPSQRRVGRTAEPPAHDLLESSGSASSGV